MKFHLKLTKILGTVLGTYSFNTVTTKKTHLK
jgi:hypothetical protein